MQTGDNTTNSAVDWELKTKELYNLLLAWKDQHCTEKSDHTRYAKISKNSFTEDGPIVPELYYTSRRKILFIGKESNIEGASANGSEVLTADGSFYTRNVVLNPDIKPRTFVINLAKIYNSLITDNYEIPNSDTENLKYAAFINLNKRGGLKSCSRRILRAYTQEYRDKIIEEIVLLAPDLIVCCGIDCYNIVKAKLAEHSKISGIPVLSSYHPSARVSDNEKLERIKNEIEKKDT